VRSTALPSICLTSRPLPLRSIALSSIDAKSWPVIVPIATAPSLGCSWGNASMAARSGRSAHWVKVKNPKAPAVRREAEEDWGR